MSYSSFYGIRKDYTGECIADFKNSWLFSPVVWNVLSDKKLPRKYGMIQSVTGMNSREVWIKINSFMNDSDNTSDRICWELSNQLIFFTKDKEVIFKAINDFIANNKKYDISQEDGLSVLERDHIIERFNEIADIIANLNEEEYPYFVFKNTSVDDEVTRWFKKWNEETDEYEDSSLRDSREYVTEFVVIENELIKEYIPNTEYKYE